MLALTFSNVIISKVLSWPLVVHAAYAFTGTPVYIAHRRPAVATPANGPGEEHWTANFYIIVIRWRISLRTIHAQTMQLLLQVGLVQALLARLLASSPPIHPRSACHPSSFAQTVHLHLLF